MVSTFKECKNIIMQSIIEDSPGYCLDPKTVILPNFEPAKYSVKKNVLVQAYAANTNQGMFRDYNEDRVSIILNITKPDESSVSPPSEPWPNSSFFAVYDGHGGEDCADFLKDELHNIIT